jgi:hypothetical protein
MSKYDIVLFIWLTLLTIGLSCVLADMLDRTKKLKDTITKLYSYINDYINGDIDPQIKNERYIWSSGWDMEHWLTRYKQANDFYTNKMCDNDKSHTDIMKINYAPEKRYAIHEPSYDKPGYELEVKENPNEAERIGN